MSWIEKLLTKIFPYFDIHRDDQPDVVYLRRFFIYPRTPEFRTEDAGKGRIYLHKFNLGDLDENCHDHPWPFKSFIINKGYWEETPANQPGDAITIKNKGFTLFRDGEWFKRIFYPRFSILARPATWQHRVILKDKTPVWTIVRTGVKERSWGFWIKGKLCPWRQYNNGVCYCTPEEKYAVKGASHES